MAVGSLNVEVTCATGLKNSELMGKSDPYVVLKVGKTEHKTTVAKDQFANPEWHQKFTLPVTAADCDLIVRVLDDDTLGRDDEIGHVTIPLSGLPHGVRSFPLEHKGKPSGGEIKLCLSFVSSEHHEGAEGVTHKVEGLTLGGESHGESHSEGKNHGGDHEVCPEGADTEKTKSKKKFGLFKKHEKKEGDDGSSSSSSDSDSDDEKKRRDDCV